MFYEYKHVGTSHHFVKERGENFNFPPHLHLCFECITVTDGEMTVTVDGRPERLYRGQSLMIFPNQLHSLDSSTSRHVLCIFSSDLIGSYAKRVAGLVPRSNLFTLSENTLQLLENGDQAENVLAQKGLLYLLCAEFDKTAVYLSKQRGEYGLLSAVFHFVEQNYSEDCSLGRISQQLGYDYAYLSRYFKQTTGLSFTEYLNRFRLGKACYLLDNTTSTILECAMEVGYTSLRTFNRNFKQLYGTSPAVYRGGEKRP